MNTNASQENRPLKFILLTFALAVPFWVFGGDNLPVPMKLPVSALAAFTPLTAAVILSYRQSGSRGVKQLFRRALDFRKIENKIWYVPILLLTPAIFILTYALMRWTGMELPDPEIPFLAIPVLMVVFFVFGIGEELGWMGYAIDPMQKRWGALKASLLLGLVWALFHLIPDLQNRQAADWIFWHRAGTIATRTLMVWIYNNTGQSVFSAILFHIMNNLSWAMFPNWGSHYNPFITGVLLCLAALIVVIGWGPKTLTRSGQARVGQA